MDFSTIQKASGTIIMVNADDLEKWARQLISETKAMVEAEHGPKYYTIKDLASELKITSATVYNYLRQGLLTPVKVGGRTLIEKNQVQQAIGKGILAKYNHFK